MTEQFKVQSSKCGRGGEGILDAGYLSRGLELQRAMRGDPPALPRYRVAVEQPARPLARFEIDRSQLLDYPWAMKFAKIRFETRAARVRALEALMQRAKVVALKGGVFIVPDRALEWLRSQNIGYTVIESLNQDDVV